MRGTGLLRELNSSTSARDRLLDRAIAEGKFPPTRRAHYARLHAQDPEATEQFIARLASAPTTSAGTGLI